MTTDQLESEIAYMKSLAVSGGRGPLKNGANLFWAGLLYGCAAVAQYAMIKGFLPQKVWVAAGIWLGVSIAYAVILAVTVGGAAKCVEAPASRTSHSAWSAVGLGILSFFSAMIVMVNLVPGELNTLSFLLAPIILVLYGVGWWVSATASGTGWMRLVALGCFGGAPVLCLLVNRPEQLLAYAAALVLFAMVPGYALMRAEKA
ncbi:hypothetical protein [Asticcacaulis solisilvae]|uniref:hypothetical protein n=1 Tax=Asticcacaulis solisilvae TaxID=1217274 RepID=UPI003FD80743